MRGVTARTQTRMGCSAAAAWAARPGGGEARLSLVAAQNSVRCPSSETLLAFKCEAVYS
jgi:hypothetical protein